MILIATIGLVRGVDQVLGPNSVSVTLPFDTLMHKVVSDVRASEFIVSLSIAICSLVTLYGLRTAAVWARRAAIAFVLFLMVGIVSEIPNQNVSDWSVWLFLCLAGAMIAALSAASLRGVSSGL